MSVAVLPELNRLRSVIDGLATPFCCEGSFDPEEPVLDHGCLRLRGAAHSDPRIRQPATFR